ncbi:unnamed protein product [Lactuca saligna]|uniref:Hexosyltransferase n=1 Tax=Lactuca saligna TaxID=75948 RepID=A0AA36EKU6_LACSI|nr:unnamed protein product [Lactuca saligna]
MSGDEGEVRDEICNIDDEKSKTISKKKIKPNEEANVGDAETSDKKGPSRSARRKKAKRQWKRELTKISQKPDIDTHLEGTNDHPKGRFTTVVVTSTVQSSLTPENIIFHVITDKKTYVGMHSWFALNPISPSIIEVKGTNVCDTVNPRSFALKLQARMPKYISLLNHLRIYLPELSSAFGRLVISSDGVWDALSTESALECSCGLAPESATTQIVKVRKQKMSNL